MDQSDPEGPAVEANEGGRLITTSRALYSVVKLINQSYDKLFGIRMVFGNHDHRRCHEQ